MISLELIISPKGSISLSGFLQIYNKTKKLIIYVTLLQIIIASSMVHSNTNLSSRCVIRHTLNRRTKAVGILNNFLYTRGGGGLRPRQKRMNLYRLPDQRNLTYILDFLFNETHNRHISKPAFKCSPLW